MAKISSYHFSSTRLSPIGETEEKKPPQKIPPHIRPQKLPLPPVVSHLTIQELQAEFLSNPQPTNKLTFEWIGNLPWVAKDDEGRHKTVYHFFANYCFHAGLHDLSIQLRQEAIRVCKSDTSYIHPYHLSFIYILRENDQLSIENLKASFLTNSPKFGIFYNVIKPPSPYTAKMAWDHLTCHCVDSGERVPRAFDLRNVPISNFDWLATQFHEIIDRS
jgi:hypothetical protein